MTLDDLFEEFKRGVEVAVVRALAKALSFNHDKCVDCHRNHRLIDEILSDAETAGGPNREDGRDKAELVVTAPATDLSHRPGCPSLVVYECTCDFHTKPTDAAPVILEAMTEFAPWPQNAIDYLTKHAPAVCEWTLDSNEHNTSYDTGCGGKWCSVLGGTPKQDNYTYCPECGKAIKFVETP